MKMTNWLVCRFAGHTFALDGDQSIADIAYQVQDDVMDEIWGVWPVCPSPNTDVAGDVEETAMWTRRPTDIAVPIGRLGDGPVSPPSLPSSSPPG